jgi:proline dehydrogenase
MIPPIANNFVAGETPSAALDHVEDLNARGVKGILNLLGEHYEDRVDADADADAYIDLAAAIAEREVDACISVKPSQIGLEVGDAAFEENLARIVDATDCFVWVDMEDHDTVDVTLDAFERHARETDGRLGVCVQANLKRTGETIERLADCPGKVRLVKGAYDPPADIAYKEKSKVDEMYREYLSMMFEQFDDGIAVGSHDPAMIEFATELHEEHGTPFEIQMLTGVREDAQFDLADEYEVYQYIPYGSKWLSYFYRRVRERKENALFALRAVVG